MQWAIVHGIISISWMIMPIAAAEVDDMKKKILSLSGLWLALVLLVLVYTDRDALTWRFEESRLDRILITQQQAEANEAAADAAMEAERAAAAARRESGEWDRQAKYGGAPTVRGAQDDMPGLNLMWGDYEVVIEGSGAQAGALRVVSAGRQAFIAGGEAALSPQEGTLRFSFTLTDSAEHVLLACDSIEEAGITRVTVRRAGQRLFSPDLAAYALFAGAVLSVLVLLSFDGRPSGRERRRDALVIVFAAVFASMPLLWQGVFGGHDLHFHLNRIEGIAAGLRAGQFPVHVHASTLLGYGYAAPQFYPELFLYIPAVMRNLGVSLAACVRVFEMGINLCAALSAYACGRRIFGDRRVALGASVLYTLCLYRLVNMYVRATLGESLAMVFFPLLIAALYDVIYGDMRRWPMLALGMTGVFMSHLLSTLFAVLFCALAALMGAKRLLRERKRLLCIAAAAAVTALCSVWFLVPMLAYTSVPEINTSVALDSYEHVMKLGAYLVGFPGDHAGIPDSAKDFAYTVGVVPGYAVMIGCALLALALYMDGAQSKRREDCASMALLGLGALALLGATECFPWAWACSLPRPLSTFFKQIQYPWRLVGVGVPMLCLAAAWGYLREEGRRTQGLYALVLLSCVLSGYTMQGYVQQSAPLLYADSFCDTRIIQHEYLYNGTEKASLKPGEIVVRAENYAVRDVRKQGTNMGFALDIPESCGYVDLPLMYYPGYQAQAGGVQCRTALGDNNVLRLYGLGSGMDIDVRVWFEPPVSWRAAQGVSAAGAVLLALLLARMKKRTAA